MLGYADPNRPEHPGLYARRVDMVERSQPANAAEHRNTQELAGLYEISRILSEIGDFVPKATAAMEKVSTLADADWVTVGCPTIKSQGCT